MEKSSRNPIGPEKTPAHTLGARLLQFVSFVNDTVLFKDDMYIHYGNFHILISSTHLNDIDVSTPNIFTIVYQIKRKQMDTLVSTAKTTLVNMFLSATMIRKIFMWHFIECLLTDHRLPASVDFALRDARQQVAKTISTTDYQTSVGTLQYGC